MVIRSAFRASLALALTAAAVPAFAQSSMSGSMSGMSAMKMSASSADTEFAMRAAEGGTDEVRLARLALKKSRNATVRAFAQKMIADHTPNNAKLAAIVRRMGMRPAAMLDENGRMMMMKLEPLNGAAFDSAYLSGQVTAHGAMQILMQSEINGGKNAALVSYARATLPAVNMHLNMAKSDVAMMGGGRMSGGSMMKGGSMSGGSMSGGSMGGGTMNGGMSSSRPMASPGSSMGGGMSSSRPMASPGSGLSGTNENRTNGGASAMPMPMTSPTPH